MAKARIVFEDDDDGGLNFWIEFDEPAAEDSLANRCADTHYECLKEALAIEGFQLKPLEVH